MIEIRDLVKSFGEHRVLDGLNLKIERGEIMVILGPSGCGKSVLLKHLIGLLRPERGKVLIDGVDVTALRGRRLDDIRRRCGMVFQGGALFDSMSIGENVGFALRERGQPEDTVRKAASETLGLVGLEGIEDQRPAELSGGMRKRVALARAIVTCPEIMLYDEPTAGIDPVMADTINHLIVMLGKRVSATSVVVTHDVSSAYQIGTRLAIFHEGKITEVGSSEEIRSSRNPVVQRFMNAGKKDVRTKVKLPPCGAEVNDRRDEREAKTAEDRP